VRRSSQDRHRATDFTDALGQHRLYRRAFFHARRKMVRIAGEADRTLTRYQELHQLGMSLVKLDLGSGNSFE
jgi:hypothetical protein